MLILSRDALLARAGALGVDQGWAGTVIDEHMNCVRTNGGKIYVDKPPSEVEVASWRNSRGGNLPDICRVGRNGESCLSLPLEARSRCFALFGNQLEVDMEIVEGERVKTVGGENFDFVTLVIGDAPLLEAIPVRSSNEAVINCDPLIDRDIASSLIDALNGKFDSSKFETFMQLLSEKYTTIVRNASDDIRGEILKIYEGLFGKTPSGLFLVKGTYQGIHVPEGFFNRIIYSMPQLRAIEQMTAELLEFAEKKLCRGGLLILRTESEALSSQMGWEIRRRVGVFESQNDERYTFPPTLHEIYFKRAQGDAIHNIVVRKR
ncbi:hypothetical protein KBD45_08155 [Candidatus Dojkabacteria bacterium]|nr:hypothetical protein [Candidatus Dojkabacteria bacterium]